VASTRRKRRTKHRGNAAGVVETRGRTGRKPTAGERKTSGRPARQDRFSKPPSWNSAMTRAGFTSAIFIVVAILILKQTMLAALAFGAFMFVLYTPLGYYTDQHFYRRRQAKLLREQHQDKT
jgi:hypothetical protein